MSSKFRQTKPRVKVSTIRSLFLTFALTSMGIQEVGQAFWGSSFSGLLVPGQWSLFLSGTLFLGLILLGAYALQYEIIRDRRSRQFYENTVVVPTKKERR